MTWIYPQPGDLPGQHDWAKPWPGSAGGTGTIILTGGNTMYTHQIRKVENGFVLKVNDQEFVFETVISLLAHLSKELETK